MEHERDLYDLGLRADLAMLAQSPLSRRQLLKLGLLGVSGFLASCAAPATTASSTAAVASGDACTTEIPTETAGPYPADGSYASNQTLNVLTENGIVRQDLRTSLSTGNVAAGVPLTIALTLVNPNDACSPLAGYAVYLWHCSREGRYSLYSQGATAEDYLRGVQASDADGRLTFTTIFPGCYAGRWPHAHFEIYPSLEAAMAAANAAHTSQLALPESTCEAVYATDGYETSVANLARVSLASDTVFGDGVRLQMATLTGDPVSGYTATLTVGVAV